MPTYRNDGTESFKIKKTTGVEVIIAPGQTVETYAPTPSFFTRINDLPYWNRIVDRQQITLSSTPQTISISAETKFVLFLQITATLTVYTQSQTNTPPEYRDHTFNDPIIRIPANGRFDQVVVTGAGTCEMIEYRSQG